MLNADNHNQIMRTLDALTARRTPAEIRLVGSYVNLAPSVARAMARATGPWCWTEAEYAHEFFTRHDRRYAKRLARQRREDAARAANWPALADLFDAYNVV